MRYNVAKYAEATDQSLPKLAEKISALSIERGGKPINHKTLWNWVQGKYKFRVVIECDDDDPGIITGVYKESRIA